MAQEVEGGKDSSKDVCDVACCFAVKWARASGEWLVQGPLIVQEKASSGMEHVQMMVAEMEGTKVTARLCSTCACVQECMQLWLMTKAGVHHASYIKEDTMVRKWDSIKIMRKGGRCGAWGGCRVDNMWGEGANAEGH